MFQANAFQINAFQIGGVAAPPVVTEVQSGGWWQFDPYLRSRRVRKTKYPTNEEIKRAELAVQAVEEIAESVPDEFVLRAASDANQYRMLREELDRIGVVYNAYAIEQLRHALLQREILRRTRLEADDLAMIAIMTMMQ